MDKLDKQPSCLLGEVPLGVGPLLNGVGDSVTKAIEKACALSTFFALVFTKVCPHAA